MMRGRMPNGDAVMYEASSTVEDSPMMARRVTASRSQPPFVTGNHAATDGEAGCVILDMLTDGLVGEVT